VAFWTTVQRTPCTPSKPATSSGVTFVSSRAFPAAFVLRFPTADVKTPFSPLQSGSKGKRLRLTV